MSEMMKHPAWIMWEEALSEELVNEIIEELECDIADKVDQIRDRLDIIFE